MKHFERLLRLTILAVLFLRFANAQMIQTAGDASSTAAASATSSITRESLESTIKSKSDALDKLNQELSAKQEALRTTKNERTSLQRELSTLEQQIGTLKLSIQSDELTGQKLGLEIDALGYDIRDIERTIDNKHATIQRLIGELYQRDTVSPLVVFIKNPNIGQTVAETQAINNVKAQLRDDVSSLTVLKANLREKLSSVSQKKNEVELRKQNQIAKKTIVEDKTEERKVVLVETKNKESIYEQQVAELQKQQNALEDEIDAIEAKLRATFDPNLAPSKRGGLLLWPVKLADESGAGRITQHYGERSYLYRGKPHNGFDIGAPIGTAVFAAEDGVVAAVDNNDKSAWRKYQYGKYILIKHPNNLSTLYGHLSRQLVQPGARVKRGELIGYVGSTGYATGAHLHFGVYWSASMQMKSIPPAAGLVPVGVTLNPEDYL